MITVWCRGGGKQRFIEMLEVRFKRRVKGDMINRLESAFFDVDTTISLVSVRGLFRTDVRHPLAIT